MITYVRRRPAQALYKPPRRSQNPEVTDPVTAPSTVPPPVTTLVEDVQPQSNINKSTKSKTARPSAEPYVPPSRRSQTLNSEPSTAPPPSKTSTSESQPVDGEKKNDEDEEEEEWEKLLDSNENSLSNDLVKEVYVKDLFSISKTQIVCSSIDSNQI